MTVTANAERDYSNLSISELIHISNDCCGSPRGAFIRFFLREPNNVEEVEAFIFSFYDQYNAKIGHRY